MELRSFNVERVYKECVKCRIGDEIGIDKAKLDCNTENIKSMCSQIARFKGTNILASANIRTDGEIWTPYLQIVEMLLLLGKKIGVLDFTFDKKQRILTLIKFK